MSSNQPECEGDEGDFKANRIFWQVKRAVKAITLFRLVFRTKNKLFSKPKMAPGLGSVTTPNTSERVLKIKDQSF